MEEYSKQMYPTTKQANILFLCVTTALLVGSSLLIPILGLGTNLWINEYIWILAPTLLFIRFGRMSGKTIVKVKKTTKRCAVTGMLSSISIWFFTCYISKLTTILLDHTVGRMKIDLSDSVSSPGQAVLTLIGMVVLAPVCEEILFRGFILSAYESYNIKYGFVITAVLFGMFHVLNGVTEVLPTFILGLVLGYLVHRTGSIIFSMLAHMSYNLCAIIFMTVLGLNNMKTIPMWFHVVGFGGLIVAIFLLRSIELKEEEMKEIYSKARYTLGSKITFALSGIFVISIGAFEIYIRINS